jgi:hypothetical protein
MAGFKFTVGPLALSRGNAMGDLLDFFIFIFGVVIGALAIAVTVHAWRSWSEHRRIEKHLGR